MCSLGRCPGVRERLRSWKCPGGFKSVNEPGTWLLSTQAPEASAGANVRGSYLLQRILGDNYKGF